MEKELDHGRPSSTPIAIEANSGKKKDKKSKSKKLKKSDRPASLQASRSAEELSSLKRLKNAARANADDIVPFTSYKDHKGYRRAKYELTEDQLEELHKHLPPAAYTHTNEEKAKLQEFAEAVKDWTKDWHSDDYFRRFLIARDWNVKDASEMFVETMKWREREGIDDIIETFPQTRYCRLLTNYWPNILSPILHTKDGHTVVIEQIGRVDTKLINLIPKEFFVRWHIYQMEIAEKIRRERAKEVGWSTGVVLIDDLRGFGMSHFYKPALDAIIEGGLLDKQYYPEGLRKMYFINTPTLFQMLFKMVKSFYDPRTLAKIDILGSNYESTLRAIIPEDELVTLYGGKQEYSFPPAGPVKGLLGHDQKNVRCVSVSRGSYHEESLQVNDKDAIIGWEFASEDYDLAFCIRRAGDPVPKKLESFNSHKQMIIGFHKVDVPGEFVLRFDNTNSWTRSKTVHYRVFVDSMEIAPPANLKSKK